VGVAKRLKPPQPAKKSRQAITRMIRIFRRCIGWIIPDEKKQTAYAVC
jgi:hypothetical protein